MPGALRVRKKHPVLGFCESAGLPGGRGAIRLVVDFLCRDSKFLMLDLPRAKRSRCELSLRER